MSDAAPKYPVRFTDLFINGEFVPARSGRRFPTIYPATTEVIAEIAEGDEADINLAVESAYGAFTSGPWPNMNAVERGRILWRIGELILEEVDEVAYLETLDTGKPINDSRRIDIPLCAEIFQYFAGWTTKITGETIPVKGDILNYTLREPLGVVGAITPWNFPLLLAVYKIAPALACGNTVVLKPAEQSPLSALYLADIVRRAGLPAGVLNVITGFGPMAGAALVKHPLVNKIAFTGESATGKEIMRNAAGTLKKISLELGGKSPNIVFADADIEAAVRGAVNGIFYNKGEVCSAGSRLFVEESIHQPFLEKVLDRSKRMIPADPMNEKCRMGPLISEEQLEKVESYVKSGKEEGAKLLAGGERVQPDGLKGFFYAPTLFDEVHNNMKIAREEIFGPVLCCIRFRDLDEAIALGNDTIYGLAAAVWTRDIRKAHTAARELKAGTIWINTYNRFDSASPFGGYKESGFGRELGSYAINEYTQVKSVWVDLS